MSEYFKITKNYSPEQGFTATFRQWRAESHCRFLHGYALGIRITLGCVGSQLDENGWVANFGGLKPFKAWLAETFDHKTLVAYDDPHMEAFRKLDAFELIQLVEVERTGCEGFAKMIGEYLNEVIIPDLCKGRIVYLASLEVYEHTGNSAIYYPHVLSLG